MDTAAQKQQARSEIVKQVIAQRQAQIEAAQKEKETQQKTTRTLLIVGGVVVGLTILGVAVYMMRKRGK
jgi:F0F1-type ATP synthase assembly protein I